MGATSVDQLVTDCVSCGHTHAADQYHGNVGKSEPTDEILRQLITGHQNGKTELTVLQMYLQTAMAEVAEYTRNIQGAKTQAKKDFYQKKIKKVTKRLQKLLPAG